MPLCSLKNLAIGPLPITGIYPIKPARCPKFLAIASAVFVGGLLEILAVVKPSTKEVLKLPIIL